MSCAGHTGSVTKIKNPAGPASASRVVSGLLSFADVTTVRLRSGSTPCRSLPPDDLTPTNE